MSFKSKVVLVTGASAGIGAATTIFFAKEGANVIIIGRNEENLKKVYEKCQQFGSKILSIKADITKDQDVKRSIEKTIETFGKLDILINNAGVVGKSSIVSENYMETYDLIMNTNLRALAVITNFAAPHIIKTKGNIVNVSSVGGKYVVESYSTYTASKAALDNFTKCMALELAPHGVRVNAVSPGPVDTNFFDKAGLSEDLDVFRKDTALGKVVKSEEVADVILYLASDKASSITGSNYVIDNGFLL